MIELERKNNSWSVHENTFVIYYMRFCIHIVPKSYNIEMQLYSDNQKLLSLKFSNYEEALDFAQTYVGDYHICWTAEDVQAKYNELYGERPKVRTKRNNNM